MTKRFNPLEQSEGGAPSDHAALPKTPEAQEGDYSMFKIKDKPLRSESTERAIQSVAESVGFPSREAARRKRNYSGRNQPFSTKLTLEYLQLIYELADKKKAPLAEIIEDALDALVAAKK